MDNDSPVTTSSAPQPTPQTAPSTPTWSTVRLPNSVLNPVRELARGEGRTFSGQLTRVILAGLQHSSSDGK